MYKAIQWLCVLLGCLLGVSALQAAPNAIYHRSFWSPTYEGLPLAYCYPNTHKCGRVVANAYCRFLGYDGADHEVIAYNVGEARFFPSRLICRDWQCHGFKTIRCRGHFPRQPVHAYDYRKVRFVAPRYLGQRVDYCARGAGKACGRPAAHSFCRRLGYRRTIGFSCEADVGATEAIMNQRRCFGAQCEGFRYIDCFR